MVAAVSSVRTYVLPTCHLNFDVWLYIKARSLAACGQTEMIRHSIYAMSINSCPHLVCTPARHNHSSILNKQQNHPWISWSYLDICVTLTFSVARSLRSDCMKEHLEAKVFLKSFGTTSWCLISANGPKTGNTEWVHYSTPWIFIIIIIIIVFFKFNVMENQMWRKNLVFWNS